MFVIPDRKQVATSFFYTTYIIVWTTTKFFLNFLAFLEAELWLILCAYAIFLKFDPT